MDLHLRWQFTAAVDSLESIVTRLGAGDPPPRGDIDCALEKAAACLIALRSRLRRSRDVSPDEPEVSELRSSIEQLERALAEVRRRCVGPMAGGAAFGFVVARDTPEDG